MTTATSYTEHDEKAVADFYDRAEKALKTLARQYATQLNTIADEMFGPSGTYADVNRKWAMASALCWTELLDVTWIEQFLDPIFGEVLGFDVIMCKEGQNVDF